MPQREDFDSLLALDSIVKVITNTEEMDLAHSGERNVQGFRTDVRLGGDELEATGQFLAEQPASSRAVGMPPSGCFPDLPFSLGYNQQPKPHA